MTRATFATIDLGTIFSYKGCMLEKTGKVTAYLLTYAPRPSRLFPVTFKPSDMVTVAPIMKG